MISFVVSFPNTDFNSIIFNALSTSTVNDLLIAATEEWGVDAEFVEVQLCSLTKELSLDDNLLSIGVSDGEEFAVCKKRECIFSKNNLINDSKDISNYFKLNPNKKCFIDIDSMLVDGVVETDYAILPESVREVVLVNCEHATAIGDNFLSNCTGLTSVDLTDLYHVKSIGDAFLCANSSLISVDLSPLANVSSVGQSFLHGCQSLSFIDLSPLHQISVVDKSFLYGCSSLSTIDLSPLNNTVVINRGFMYGCKQITDIDFSVLSSIREVEKLGFLKNSGVHHSMVNSIMNSVDRTTISRSGSISV